MEAVAQPSPTIALSQPLWDLERERLVLHMEVPPIMAKNPGQTSLEPFVYLSPV